MTALTAAERKRKQRALDRAEGLVEITLLIPQHRVAAFRKAAQEERETHLSRGKSVRSDA